MFEITSSMAGTVLQINVSIGNKVEHNQEVVLLESMKMEIPVESTSAGIVREIKVTEGDFVNEGDVLIVLE